MGKVKADMERLRSEVRMHRLSGIREAWASPSRVLADQIGVSQFKVSQIERGELERTKASGPRSYIHEYGGQVEVFVR